MPNLNKQELESLYKYFSANRPKWANTGNFSAKKSKLEYAITPAPSVFLYDYFNT